MTSAMCFVAYISVAVVIYVYFGYPLLLYCLQYIFPGKKIQTNREFRPFVTLIISCFNEEEIIEEKLNNCLALEYPYDLLEIIVVSDASTDRTDAIVKSFPDERVRLIRQDERLGKTSGLNLAVSKAHGEILVFSDANAMYEPDALIQMVIYFADKTVGYVVGEARYKDPETTAAGTSEGVYWHYEIKLKTMESKLHSIVGGDGAIYAIRKELYKQLRTTDINDFVNPLQIIAMGFRGIYAPKAICWEDASGVFGKEFNRKVRIVNRAFSGLFRVKEVLNPFRTGIFSFEIISHKLLRWLVPFFLISFLGASFVLSSRGIIAFQYINLFMLLFCWLAYIGYLFAESNRTLPVFHYPYYFILVNLASLIGVIRSLCGHVQATWSPSRIAEGNMNKLRLSNVAIHIFAACSFIFTISYITNPTNAPYWQVECFWLVLLVILCYVYFGYPLVLALLGKIRPRPIKRDDNYTPEVALLICAYNEQEVIEEKIKNCFDLDYPDGKIKFIIASDGSEDGTREIVNRYIKDGIIFYDYPERKGKIGAILATVPKIDSEIILFSDANTMYHPGAVRSLMRNFADPSVGGVSADVILTNDTTAYSEPESLYYKYERWIQEAESRIGSIIGADGGMYAIRRKLFKAPSSNTILDDFVISMNVALQGFRLVYEGEARGYEKNVNSCYVEFLKKSRVVAGAVQAIRQNEGIPDPGKGLLFFCYFSHKFLRWHVPVLMITFLPLSTYIFWVTDNFFPGLILAGQLLFYFFAVLGGITSGRIKLPILYIPFYFFLVNGAALYGLYKGWRNRQPTKWQVFSRKENSLPVE